MSTTEPTNPTATVTTAMSSTSYNKAPPKLSGCKTYNDWVKLIGIWLTLTPLEKSKQGPALILSLEGKAQEVALQLDASEISADNGAQNVIEKLNSLYKKDALIEKFNDVESYETYKRPSECSIKDFIVEFEKRLYKIKSHGIQPSDDLSAYRLLKAANLSSTHEQMVKATINNLSFVEIKTKLSKIFSVDSNILSDNLDKFNIKEEATFYSDRNECSSANVPLEESDDCSDEENDTFFMKRGKSNRYQNTRQDQYRGKSYGTRPKKYVTRTNNATEQPWRSDDRKRASNTSQKGKNPLDKEGNSTRCLNCESINHWAHNCPDKSNSEQTYIIHEIVLHHNDLSNPEQMKTLVAESWSSGLLDCGASKTVCGKIWLDEYTNALSENDKLKVVYYSSSSCYKFGDGKRVQAHQGAKIPAYIGNTSVMITTDVIDKDLPLLLSKAFMKNANMVLNFKNDTACAFEEIIPLIVTSSGHYVIPISKPKQLINNIEDANITLAVQNAYSNEQIALKLHRQFGHPTKDKLLQLINRSDPQWSNNQDLKSCIERISSHCEICQKYQPCPARPIVGLPMATQFCETVAMDLKEIDGKIILHLIDMCTRLSAGTVVNNKQPVSIIQGVFKCFLQVYGSCDKILVDNGGEFVNKDFISMAESFGIIVKTTAAFSPWSNGMIERHNKTLEGIMRKILADSDINFEIALAWAFNAKNSLCNSHGFSAFQLSIGRNPKLPCSLNDSLPALTNQPTTKVLQDNLDALHKARKAFIELESSDRIKRALSHNIRTSSETNYISGDSVYFKRPNQGSWHGPGKVLGQDGQQVLIKNGSYYIRAHKCNVRLVREDTKPSENCEEEIQDQEENLECSDDSIVVPDATNATSVTDMHNEINPDSISSSADNASLTNNDASTIQKLKPNMKISCLDENGQLIKANVASRAGKASGKYKNWWNVTLEDGTPRSLNLDTVRDIQVETPESHQFNNVMYAKTTEEVQAAKEIELDQWKIQNVYTEEPDVGQTCISLRWVITPKVIDNKPSVKARLVARGFEETKDFKTDSPTCSREGTRLALALIAANKWKLKSLDVKTAFLQGDSINRTVYVRPPAEAKTNLVWKLNKTVYGLADASRNWYTKLRGELIKLGCIPCKIDPGIFCWYHENKLVGIMISFVDDILRGGVPYFEEIVVKLRDVFSIGVENCNSFNYIGIELHQNEDYSILLSQKNYIDNLEPIDIDDPKNDRPLNSNEITKLREGLGQLNWVACMSRPEISFLVSELTSQTKSATVSDIKRLNKGIKFLKDRPNTVLIPSVNLENSFIMAYSDASFGKQLDGGSQGGDIIFLADDNKKVAVLSWSSNRLRRVVRSTLSAEALQFCNTSDTAFFLNSLLCEVLGKESGFFLPTSNLTDSRSLFEQAGTYSLCSDKRLRVDISAIRESVRNSEMKIEWVPKEQMIADVLTKSGSNPDLLMSTLKNGCVSH